MRKFLRWTGVIAAVLGGAYWWFAMDGSLPESSHFDLDLAKVRRLAGAIPGDRPREIRYEHMATFQFPGAEIVAGDGWSRQPMPVYAWQLVYADRTVIVDTGVDRADGPVASYDDASYRSLQQALDKASLIVLTHEHDDHIGGLVHHPNLQRLLKVTQLTDVQVHHPERMRPARFPRSALDGYQPLHYDRLHALAPGVVLIAAPGHTPGSQMVYVRLADGRELLFLGDVAWHLRNVETRRERPRWATDYLLAENRFQVAGELKALHALNEAAPDLRLIPGHDGDVVDGLTHQGWLQPGFVR